MQTTTLKALAELIKFHGNNIHLELVDDPDGDVISSVEVKGDHLLIDTKGDFGGDEVFVFFNDNEEVLPAKDGVYTLALRPLLQSFIKIKFFLAVDSLENTAN